MSDSTPDTATEQPDPALEEWKPEPRTWAWKDLFTAPMLAFKPKCMLISAVTLVALMVLAFLWDRLLGTVVQWAFVYYALSVIGLIIAGSIFTLGASLVAVFMKADLLDDEFLSLGEALGQFKKRMVPAIMVPTFLIATVVGFLLLIYIGMLLVSIPIVGGIIYVVLYPFAFLLALLTVLIAIAVILSAFLVPSIVAIRKHGWFDNVIDTFEAVGTKPHVVVLNLALTVLIAMVAFGIAHSSMRLLTHASAYGLGSEPARVEYRAQEIKQAVKPWVSPFDEYRYLFPAKMKAGEKIQKDNYSRRQALAEEIRELQEKRSTLESSDARDDLQAEIDALDEQRKAVSTPNGFHTYGTGLITGIWQAILMIVIAGYTLNVLIAGGMLTYLFVREDDYWDDEDLEDLDKLAKELEDEAKAEAAKAESDGTEPSTAPAPAGAPPEQSAADGKQADGETATDSTETTDEQEKPASDTPAEDETPEKKDATESAEQTKEDADKPASEESTDDDKPQDDQDQDEHKDRQ